MGVAMNEFFDIAAYVFYVSTFVTMLIVGGSKNSGVDRESIILGYVVLSAIAMALTGVFLLIQRLVA